ncbi:MAG: hypothetical protein HFJ28_02750 [Clostridia bacterium]|nr:hypothetical protein [Clostridia bacterium]
MLDNFESISPTAIVTAYPRQFTDIPYEKQIYEWLKANYKNNDVKLNKLLAPEIEARYKLTNKILDALNIEQVIEIAAGYSSRGIIYAQKGYEYIEMDLDEVAENKVKLLKDIATIPDNLHITSGNALKYADFEKCGEFLDKNKEVAIINEGLLRYLTFEEKEIVARNIYNVLKKQNGVWITCDVTPKKFIQKQNNFMPDFNNNLNLVTSRNNLTDRFENIEHINKFMKDIGFNSVEIHKFIEVKDELSSFDILEIDRNSANEVLNSAIVAVIKI